MKSKKLGVSFVAMLALAGAALALTAGTGLLAGWNVSSKEKIPPPSPTEMEAKIKQIDIGHSVEKCGGWDNGQSKVSRLFSFWDEVGQRAMCIARCAPKSIHKEGERHEWPCGAPPVKSTQ